MIRLVAVACARGKALPPVGFRMDALTELRVHARTSRAGRRCLSRGRSHGGPQAAGGGDSQLWRSWVNCRPLPHSGGDITGFPSSLFFLTPCPSRPRSSLKLHRRECRTHSPELGQSWTDPGGREFPADRGPAGRWHAARRQTSRVQICTSRFLRGLPPEGFSASPQEAVSGGFLGGDEEISIPDRLGPALGHPRSPTGIPGSVAQGESGASGR